MRRLLVHLFPAERWSPRATLVGVALLGAAMACALSLRAEDDPAEAARDQVIVETVLRLEGFDLASSEKAHAAVLRHLRRQPGTEQYFQLVERFKLVDVAGDLVALAIAQPGDTQGVRAARVALGLDGGASLRHVLEGDDAAAALALATAVGNTATPAARDLLSPLVVDRKRPLPLRVAAASALGRDVLGQRLLLGLARDDKLPADLKFTVANALHASNQETIRHEAAKLLPLPASANAQPLPPLAELAQRRGDSARGKVVFDTVGTCNKCHTVRGAGKDVGPNLSEIGDKLSREALLVSILDPSAGISHSYETYEVTTEDGQIVVGLLVSQTPEAITLKGADAIVRPFPSDEVVELRKLQTSLMPADLQKLLTAEQLVDVVEYLATLKK